ncbi:MAG: MFS transporter [Victivallales bacterium]|jgi:predicted MFS family arabinose efflux permease|nr:MFS transporter [Victivallales bacterium]
MIQNQPLTKEQRAKSQTNYNIFNLINGLSYMCLGETVLILLAVRLGCPDYIIAILGAIQYLGYVLLPLGKNVTAKVGAARTQSVFWIARNTAALLVASSAFVSATFGDLTSSTILLLCGAFLFYGFRAAGAVMAQPLIGDITTDADRGKFLGFNAGIFYISALVALSSISFLLKISDNLNMLTGIIIVGAVLGFISSQLVNRVDETESPRNSARKSIKSELRATLQDKSLLRLLWAGLSVNVAVITIMPISMLALKRGYGVSDTDALLYALAQFGACAVGSFVSGKISNAIGPRKAMLYNYILLLGAGVLWFVCPQELNRILMIFTFLLVGSTYIGTYNSVMHYFLQSVPSERHVSGSIFIAVVNGVGAGIIGMLLSGFLLDICDNFAPEGNPLYGYKTYFVIIAFLLTPGIWLIARLAPLPLEKRKIEKSWSETT